MIGFDFEPGALAADLDSVGLSLVEQLAPADIQARYFAGRSDGYRALEHTHFAAARVICAPSRHVLAADDRANWHGETHRDPSRGRFTASCV